MQLNPGQSLINIEAKSGIQVQHDNNFTFTLKECVHGILNYIGENKILNCSGLVEDKSDRNLHIKFTGASLVDNLGSILGIPRLNVSWRAGNPGSWRIERKPFSGFGTKSADQIRV
jgi:hypothetical protein